MSRSGGSESEAGTAAAADAGCPSERVLCDGSCAPGYADCEDGGERCETALSSSAHCGACGAACADGLLCSPRGAGGFACVDACSDPFPNHCNGACTHYAHDDRNCGGCGEIYACSGGMTCQEGRCACPLGTLDCGEGACQAPSTRNSCGTACGVACPAPASHGNPVCAGTSCAVTCQSGYEPCDGQCVSLQTVEHCGACGVACDSTHSAGASCDGTSCSYAGCSAGWDDCDRTSPNTDGCETSLATSSHCGRCGRSCVGPHVASATCAAGVCAPSCASGYQDCNKPVAPAADDGCECTGTGCCGTGCQTRHDNGQGVAFFDCIPGFSGVLDSDEDLALHACFTVTTGGNCFSCVIRSVYAVCAMDKPRCWGFQGQWMGKLYSWPGGAWTNFDCSRTMMTEIGTWR